MPEVQLIPGYANRYFLRQAILTAAGFAFFFLIWIGGNSGEIRLWIGIIGVAVCAVLQFGGMDWYARHFRCPKCGARLPVLKTAVQTDRRPRLRFQCLECDIIWDTGLRQ